MPIESVLLIILLAIPGVVVTLLVIINFERHIPEYLEDDLLRTFAVQVVPDAIHHKVNFADLASLPAPVARYLRHALTDGQPLISLVKTNQTGELRTKTSSEKWYRFSAKYLATPIVPGFVWGAKLNVFPKTWLRILDAYIAGVGIGKVDLLSVIPLGADSNVEALNSGALYRYLAEAVWYPTALLPGFGVEWSPIDDRSAMARLTNNGISVSLEFRFNERNEVAGIYTPSRPQKLNGDYQPTAWEGHFANYTDQSGLRVPAYGEVGWYSDGEWRCVWKATITDIRVNFYKG
jgi:hypothetical protein